MAYIARKSFGNYVTDCILPGDVINCNHINFESVGCTLTLRYAVFEAIVWRFFAISGSCLSPDFGLKNPDFNIHGKTGLFRTGPSPDSITTEKVLVKTEMIAP